MLYINLGYFLAIPNGTLALGGCWMGDMGTRAALTTASNMYRMALDQDGLAHVGRFGTNRVYPTIELTRVGGGLNDMIAPSSYLSLYCNLLY